MLLPFGGCNIETFVRGQDPPVQEPVYVTESFTQVPLPKVDLLWIVDNTGSMAEEQSALADAFPGFVDTLEDAELGYHLGVVTTDVETDGAGVLQGDPWIITPAATDPACAFASAVSVGTGGLGTEAGLAALILALEEPNRSGANRGFRRPDAALHVVVVSDDDDDSWDALGADPVLEAIALLDDEARRTRLPAVFSAVVGDPGTGCRGALGDAGPGDAYARVVEATDGVLASICSADLSAVAEQLAALSVHYPARFALSAEPWTDAVRVSVDGDRLDDGWTLERDPPAVVFDAPPAARAGIEVRYQLEPEP
ncbi:MAG: hypothetical protein H6739_05205 [Alphaproteobacteria bacterium]|nr:hypothetical protein [Alphaproteobacteria bacterium]